ncbi:hypothetical protein UZ36_03430 [Candidatus Nitromaritima sp. SCGC AAA799-C22]|nr:hypothetical protein UZ36_03430 [Candidatus Nitromaritima sp. SCGC AAA799-C22]
MIMNFRDVETVGQAFVDEVFRIFPLRYPEIKIEYVKANEDVRFMIERGLNDPSKQIPLPFFKPEPKNR